MNKFKYFILTTFILVILAIFIYNKNNINSEELIDVEVGTIGDDFPITRALAAKMIALSNETKEEIKSTEKVISFSDISDLDWYEKYVNYVYKKEFMSGINETEFNPNGNLTLQQAQFLIEQIKSSSTTRIKITQENKDRPITYSLWLEIYKKIFETTEIEEKEIVILGTSSTLKDLSTYSCATDDGILSFEGMEMDKYINKKIKILKKDNEVLAILEVLSNTPVLNSSYIYKVNQDNLTLFIAGIYKNFKFDPKILQNINSSVEGSLADIEINGESIVSINIYKEYIRGSINLINQNIIRINNTNYVKDEKIQVYSILGDNVKLRNTSDLTIGQDIAKYFVKENENKIYGAIIDKEASIEKVRVAISTDNFKSLFFENIKIKSESGFNLYVKGQEKVYSPSEILNISPNQDFNIGEKEIIIIKPINENEGLNIIGLKRGYENPNFKGSIEICKINEKYLVINEVLLNDYIKSVLSSNNEIPKSEEFIKAFSIILRTNTINKINENNFYEYGANFDDSPSFQTYNNLELNEKINNYVNNTEDLVIYSDNKIESLNYFAYSAGITGNSGEIWPARKSLEFPTVSPAHLKSVKLFEDSIFNNLTEEINANIFFKTKDINSIESNSNWFRWSTNINLEDFTLNLTERLQFLYKNYPNFIKILQEEGVYKSLDIPNITKINDIKVNKRGEAGNIMEIEIFTDSCQIILMTDQIIKQFFKITEIIDNKGNKIKDIYNIPSSYFVFDKIYDQSGNLEKINLYGGGYGHGVGFSIYGAEILEKNGQNYSEILKTFYSDIEILSLY